MKKAVVFLLMALLSMCFFTSCSREGEKLNADIQCEDELHIDENTFYLPGGLPEIGNFSGSGSGRYYEKINTDFVLGENYGLVLPYVAQSRVFETSEEDEWKVQMRYSSFGVCDKDGKIITDPSGEIQYVSYTESEDGFGIYELSYGMVASPDAEDEFSYYKCEYVPTNGKWVLSFDKNTWISYMGEGYICICTYPEENSYNSVIKMYDYDGNLLKKLDGVDNIFDISDGIMLCSGYDENGEYRVFFRSVDGEMLFGPYQNAFGFKDRDVTYVKTSDDEMYLINRKGERISDIYEHFTYETSRDETRGLFVARVKKDEESENSDGKKHFDFFDVNGNKIGSFSSNSNYFSLAFPKNGENICYYTTREYDEEGMPIWTTDRTVFVRVSGGEEIFNEEYGVSPNDYGGGDDVFLYCDDENKKAVFMDSFGNTLLAVDDFYQYLNTSYDGKYFCYQTGEYESEYNKETGKYDVKCDTRKTHVYDVENCREEACFDFVSSVWFEDNGSRYLRITQTDENDWFGGLSKIWIYDTEKHGLIFENADDVTCFKILGKKYFNVSIDNTSCLYDENLNVIIKNYYE